MSSKEVESDFNVFVQTVKLKNWFWAVYVSWGKENRKFFQGISRTCLDELIGVLFELSMSREIVEISSDKYGRDIVFPAIALYITFGETGSLETNVSEQSLSILSELPK